MVDVAKRPRWTGSRALVPLSPDVCPTCGHHLDVERMHEPALIRHGGFGATRRSVRRHCPGCGWSLIAETTEESPRAVTPPA